jgi:beta-fructofuranosidase
MNRRELLIGATAATIGGGNSFAGPMAADLAADPRRPQYHFLPPANWMNDPNGPIFWNGQYHMFYQHNPAAAVWGDMHWGHAVSPDMIHWRHLPVALAPTPGGPDADGCFSGSVVLDRGVPTLLYTGVKRGSAEQATIAGDSKHLRETQCLATSADRDLKTWTKLHSPVIGRPPQAMKITGFRDPAPFRIGNSWYLCIGSGELGKGGVVLLYRSRDLRHWEYLHPLAEGKGNGKSAGNPVDSGEMWECPDFFPLGGKHVLIHSTEGKVYWQSGMLGADLRFHAERTGLLDHGTYYAPKTQLDATGQRILWGWIPETRPMEEYRAAGWAGLLSLPRVLSLDSDGDLVMAIAPQVAALRAAPLNAPKVTTGAGEFSGTAHRGIAPFTVSLMARDPLLSIEWDPADPGSIRIDRQALPLRDGIGTDIDFSFHVDGSVIEVLLDHRIAVTRRFYEPGTTAPVISALVSGGQDQVAITAWEMEPISPYRLTR